MNSEVFSEMHQFAYVEAEIAKDRQRQRLGRWSRLEKEGKSVTSGDVATVREHPNVHFLLCLVSTDVYRYLNFL